MAQPVIETISEGMQHMCWGVCRHLYEEAPQAPSKPQHSSTEGTSCAPDEAGAAAGPAGHPAAVEVEMAAGSLSRQGPNTFATNGTSSSAVVVRRLSSPAHAVAAEQPHVEVQVRSTAEDDQLHLISGPPSVQVRRATAWGMQGWYAAARGPERNQR
jgi:hypothetical protein